MSWFKGFSVVCCTATLVVAGNGESTFHNARLPEPHATSGRYPVLPRLQLSFRNETRTSLPLGITSQTSNTPLVLTPTPTESSATSELDRSDAPSSVTTLWSSPLQHSGSAISQPALTSKSLFDGSNDASPTPSTMDTSVSATPTQSTQAVISTSYTLSARVSKLDRISSSLSSLVSFVRSSSTIEPIPSISKAQLITSTSSLPATSDIVETSKASSIGLVSLTSYPVASTSASSSVSLASASSGQDQSRMIPTISSVLPSSTETLSIALPTTISKAMHTTTTFSSSQQNSLSDTDKEAPSMVLPVTQTTSTLLLASTTVADTISSSDSMSTASPSASNISDNSILSLASSSSKFESTTSHATSLSQSMTAASSSSKTTVDVTETNELTSTASTSPSNISEGNATRLPITSTDSDTVTISATSLAQSTTSSTPTTVVVLPWWLSPSSTVLTSATVKSATFLRISTGLVALPSLSSPFPATTLSIGTVATPEDGRMSTLSADSSSILASGSRMPSLTTTSLLPNGTIPQTTVLSVSTFAAASTGVSVLPSSSASTLSKPSAVPASSADVTASAGSISSVYTHSVSDIPVVASGTSILNTLSESSATTCLSLSNAAFTGTASNSVVAISRTAVPQNQTSQIQTSTDGSSTPSARTTSAVSGTGVFLQTSASNLQRSSSLAGSSGGYNTAFLSSTPTTRSATTLSLASATGVSSGTSDKSAFFASETGIVSQTTGMVPEQSGASGIFAPENNTVSTALSSETTTVSSLDTSVFWTNTASRPLFSTSSIWLSPSSGTQTVVISTTSQAIDAPTSTAATQTSYPPFQKSDSGVVRATPPSLGGITFQFLSQQPPMTSTVSSGQSSKAISSVIGSSITLSESPVVTSIVRSSVTASTQESIQSGSTTDLRSSASARSSSLTIDAISSFVTRTKTASSRSGLHTDSAPSPTSRATETVVPAAAPVPLTPSETAGVAIGSAAGALIALVAVIFVARRYYAAHAAKRRSAASSGFYPKVAYLYDPSLGGNGDDMSGDEEAMAFMSGGAGGMPNKRTPPLRVPHNSLEHSPRHYRYSTGDLRYCKPANPFGDPDDPFLDWRSSDTPNGAAAVMAAAIAGYGAGPQKPLPAIPDTSSKERFQDHVIPSPTLSPLVPTVCSLRRSHARSSRGNSVRSQRSLKRLRTCPSPNPASKDYPPLSPYGPPPRQSLASTRKSDSSDPFPEPFEHDLLLPVDVRTETPDSVMVYAPSPMIKSTPMRPILPTIVSESTESAQSKPSNQNTTAAQCQETIKPRSTGSILFPKDKDTGNNYPWLLQANTTSNSDSEKHTSEETLYQSTYSVSPEPPQPTPINKGWEEIKRSSNNSTTPISPIPKSAPFTFPLPPRSFTPPPPLKKRSLIQLRRKAPLSGTGQPVTSNPSSHSHSHSHSPLTVNTSFTYNSNASFEGPRMSLLAKVHSMGDMKGRDNRAFGPGVGLGIGYRGSVENRKKAEHWSPDTVGGMF